MKNQVSNRDTAQHSEGNRRDKARRRPRRVSAAILLCTLLLALLCGCERSVDLVAQTETPQTAKPIQVEDPEQTAKPSQAGTPEVDGEVLVVHFIDVGQADASLLVYGEDTMLIDGGNVADSSLLVSYLDEQGITQLDYMVCTHAHEDHVGGLSGPLNTCTVNQVFAPVRSYDTKAFGSFVKYTQEQGLDIAIPQADDTFQLGDATVTVLGPRRDYEGENTNNTSIVLRVEFGDTSFLFTGDMEREAEADLLDAGCNLAATVLKVGHHGSDTSTSYPFLRSVMPQYAIISVGEENPYGHPTENVLSKLRDAGAEIHRTDEEGTIIATSDGTAVTLSGCD